MKGGFVGKWLRVDLTSGKLWETSFDDETLKNYGGQVGIGLKILWDEVPAGVKGTDPENRLILSTGPLTGTATHTSSNFMGITRNPDSGNATSWASSHGFWGARLKFAGFDGIVVQGHSDKPVYLWVHDGQYELRDASKFWGKMDNFETEEAIKQEVRQDKASVLTIGPAGENLVDSATAQNDHGHFLGNGSHGVVMGSKNLKAIAVYGTGKVPVADPERAKETSKVWREESMTMPNTGAATNAMGTLGYVGGVYPMGDLPLKNFQTNEWDKVDNISLPVFRTWEHKWKPCYGCSIHHVFWTTVGDGPYKGLTVEEPEYEGVSGLSSMLLIEDAGAAAWLNNENDRLGFDCNWAGTALGWSFEAYEKGLITKEDTNGIELKWGDEQAAGALLRSIAYKDSKLGKALAEGLRKAAKEFGGESFLVHFKGKGNKSHDCRSLWGMFLGLCVSNRGPAWENMGFDLNPDPEFCPGGEDRFDHTVKAKSGRGSEIKNMIVETLGVCRFGMVSTDKMLDHFNAVTGQSLTKEEGFLLGEKLSNLARAFNVRHGFKPVNDLDIGPRLLEAPVNGGSVGKSIAPYLEDMVKDYNRLMDWDWETGKPSIAKLQELGLNEVIKEFY